MRKRKICALMMTLCLLLGSCGTGDGGWSDEELALEIRGEYLGMTTCAAVMDVTADYGQRVYDYTMELSYEKDGETVLTVVAPEHIAGVTARIANGAATMEYDGVSLETGALDTQGLSPVGAVPAMLKAVCQGYMAEIGADTLGETETLRVTYRDPDVNAGTGTECSVWFNLADHSLARGEISVDGRMVVRCVFTEFSKA